MSHCPTKTAETTWQVGRSLFSANLIPHAECNFAGSEATERRAQSGKDPRTGCRVRSRWFRHAHQHGSKKLTFTEPTSPPAGPVRRNQGRRSAGDLPLLPRQADSAFESRADTRQVLRNASYRMLTATFCEGESVVRRASVLDIKFPTRQRLLDRAPVLHKKRKQNLMACPRYVPLVAALAMRSQPYETPLRSHFSVFHLFYSRTSGRAIRS